MAKSPDPEDPVVDWLLLSIVLVCVAAVLGRCVGVF